MQTNMQIEVSLTYYFVFVFQAVTQHLSIVEME